MHYLTFDLDLGGSRSHEMLPSTLNIMWPMYLQSWSFHVPRFWRGYFYKKKKYLTWSQCHMKCCQVPSTSCDICTWSCYVREFWRCINKKYSSWPDLDHQGHTKHWQVPSSLCDLCSCKVWNCYIQQFRRRYIYTRYSIRPFEFDLRVNVGKDAKIRTWYNQVPHLTQNSNGNVTNSQLITTNESQEVKKSMSHKCCPVPSTSCMWPVQLQSLKLLNQTV